MNALFVENELLNWFMCSSPDEAELLKQSIAVLFIVLWFTFTKL